MNLSEYLDNAREITRKECREAETLKELENKVSKAGMRVTSSKRKVEELKSRIEAAKRRSYDDPNAANEVQQLEAEKRREEQAMENALGELRQYTAEKENQRSLLEKIMQQRKDMGIAVGRLKTQVQSGIQTAGSISGHYQSVGSKLQDDYSQADRYLTEIASILGQGGMGTGVGGRSGSSALISKKQCGSNVQTNVQQKKHAKVMPALYGKAGSVNAGTESGLGTIGYGGAVNNLQKTIENIPGLSSSQRNKIHSMVQKSLLQEYKGLSGLLKSGFGSGDSPNNNLAENDSPQKLVRKPFESEKSTETPVKKRALLFKKWKEETIDAQMRDLQRALADEGITDVATQEKILNSKYLAAVAEAAVSVFGANNPFAQKCLLDIALEPQLLKLQTPENVYADSGRLDPEKQTDREEGYSFGEEKKTDFQDLIQKKEAISIKYDKLGFVPLENPNVRQFSDEYEAKAWGDRHYSTWRQSIEQNSDIKKSILYYTAGGSTEINASERGDIIKVRKQAKHPVEYYLAHGKNLHDTLKTAEIPEDIVVYRAIPQSAAEEMGLHAGGTLESGVILHDRGFMSTSRIAENAFSKLDTKRCIMRIVVPQGTNAVPLEYKDLSSCINESELLIDKGHYLLINMISKCRRKDIAPSADTNDEITVLDCILSK